MQHLASESLSLLADYLSAKSVFHLYLCGNRILNTKLEHGVRNLKIIVSSPYDHSLLSFGSKFRSLHAYQHVSLPCYPPFFTYTLPNHFESFNPNLLSLSLQLSSSQALDSQKPLCDLFPNLQSLFLIVDELEDSFASQLPKSLTCLRMFHQESFTLAFLNALPTTITDLDARIRLCACPNETAPIWPPNLTRLKTCTDIHPPPYDTTTARSHPYHFKDLPSSLTSLEYQSSSREPLDYENSPTAFHYLPRHLLHLTIRHPSAMPFILTTEAICELPPGLLSLSLCEIRINKRCLFPASITNLEIKTPHYQYAEYIPELPPNIKNLKLEEVTFTPSYRPPSSLTQLSCSYFATTRSHGLSTTFMDEPLPNSITKLDLHCMTNSCDETVFQCLPTTSLTSLSISLDNTTFERFFSKTYTSFKWPSTLQKLALLGTPSHFQRNFLPSAWLSYLPSSLETFILAVPFYLVPFNTITLLPPSITYFGFCSELVPQTIDFKWPSQLQHLAMFSTTGVLNGKDIEKIAPSWLNFQLWSDKQSFSSFNSLRFACLQALDSI
jgi:hypothetical protein